MRGDYFRIIGAFFTFLAACQELDVLGQQIGFGLRVLPCAPTDHLYPDFRRRHKV